MILYHQKASPRLEDYLSRCSLHSLDDSLPSWCNLSHCLSFAAFRSQPSLSSGTEPMCIVQFSRRSIGNGISIMKKAKTNVKRWFFLHLWRDKWCFKWQYTLIFGMKVCKPWRGGWAQDPLVVGDSWHQSLQPPLMLGRYPESCSTVPCSCWEGSSCCPSSWSWSLSSYDIFGRGCQESQKCWECPSR